MIGVVNIIVVPGREYLVSSPSLANLEIYYNGGKIGGPNTNNRFVAVSGVNSLTVYSTAELTANITLTEYVRNMYDNNDGQAGTWAYHPAIEKWVSRYSYTPEAFSMVGNRLVSFKNGGIYIHNSSIYNTFYGYTSDSVIAFPHNEGANSIKTYESLAIEGDAPDRVHVRTENPNLQSSDLVLVDFKAKEGVQYSPIYRDRLSPNTAGTVVEKLYNGDYMRGEIAKMMIVYNQPTTLKELKFVSVEFNPSSGQTV